MNFYGDLFFWDKWLLTWRFAWDCVCLGCLCVYLLLGRFWSKFFVFDFKVICVFSGVDLLRCCTLGFVVCFPVVCCFLLCFCCGFLLLFLVSCFWFI